jgi:hypothetical protein
VRTRVPLLHSADGGRGVKNVVLLTLQLIVQTARSKTVCSGYCTMRQICNCVILRMIVRSTWWPVPGR